MWLEDEQRLPFDLAPKSAAGQAACQIPPRMRRGLLVKLLECLLSKMGWFAPQRFLPHGSSRGTLARWCFGRGWCFFLGHIAKYHIYIYYYIVCHVSCLPVHLQYKLIIIYVVYSFQIPYHSIFGVPWKGLLVWARAHRLEVCKSCVCPEDLETQNKSDLRKLTSLRIIGPSYGGVWLCIAGFWDLQTTSLEIPWFLGLAIYSDLSRRLVTLLKG